MNIQSYSEWVRCPSKLFPGKFFYIKVQNRGTAWGPGGAQVIAARPPETPKETESHNHHERNMPPAPDPLQNDFLISSVRRTPETRHGVTSFSSNIHPPTEDPMRQKISSLNYMRHPTPVSGQKIFPRSLPKHEDSNVTCTPIQSQVDIPLQNQASTTFGAEYRVLRDHPHTANADRSQVSQSSKGLKLIAIQDLDDTECKEVLVDASNIPMHQRFVNFEAPGIIFTKVNKDNIKKLHQKFKSSTPIMKSRMLEDPRLANKPRVFESKSSLNFADFRTNTPDFKQKTENSVIKEPVLNSVLFSNTNKQDLNVGQPTKMQEQRVQNFYVGPPITTTEPVFNSGLFTKSRDALLSNGLPSKYMERSLNFEPPLKTKEPCVNYGPPSKITKPLFNLEQPLKETCVNYGPPSKITEPLFNLEQPLKETCVNYGPPSKITEPLLNSKQPLKEPVLYCEPPSKTKQLILNAGPHSKATETIFNGYPPQTDPGYFNLRPKNEPSNQYLNVEPALKTREPVLNGLPSKPTDKEINKESESILKGSVNSLKSCIKGDKGDNAVAKSFADDLRAVLISKRKSQDLQGTKPNMSKQETAVKKKVSFNLDLETLSMVSSMEDDDDAKCVFIESYRPTMSYLKALAPASSQESWCILADTEVLTKDFDFIDHFVLIDPTCRLLIPPVVHSWLLALARSCDRPLATAARNVLRRTTSSHVVVQPSNNREHPTCTNDAILRCCVENMNQNKHIILISNDLELLTTAKCYPIHCYSMNSIKNGLPTTKPLQYKKDMKITIRNDTQNVENDSVIKKSSFTDDLNDKEKAIIRNFKMAKYQTGQNPNLKEKKQNENPNGKFQNGQTGTGLNDKEKAIIRNFKMLKYQIGQNPNLKEKKQNENPNGKFQNGQTGTGPNDKNEKPIKYFYHNENMRIADAIEMYHIDSQNLTASGNTSGPSNGTLDISNISTIQNESMDIEKSFQSIPTIDNIHKLNIKDTDEANSLNTNKTVSVFFKNRKPDDMHKFKYSPQMIISVNNNNIHGIAEENNERMKTEKENQKPHFKNKGPRLENRKSNASILELCKEKIKEPLTTEFEDENTRATPPYDTTTFDEQTGKKSTSSQFDRSKSNMVSTSNGFDVSRPQTIMNRIDLNRFYVKSTEMEHRLTARIDEWVCFYTQIMEESLSSVLERLSPPVVDSPPPWSLFEALQYIETVCEDNTYVSKIVCYLRSCLYDTRNKMKESILPVEFMKAFGCGAKLLEYLEIILPTIIEIQDGVSALQALLHQIEDDAEPTISICESLVTTALNSKTYELDARQNFVKDRSQVTDYLKKHFAAWKDYHSSQDIKILRSFGKEGIKLGKRAKKSNVKNEDTIDKSVDGANSTTKTNNVGKYCDESNVDDTNLFLLDTDKNIGVRKVNYGKNKGGAMRYRNTHFEKNNDEDKPYKATDSNHHDEKGPTIIRNVGILKEFEKKLRKRKTKPDYADIKPVKKTKIDVKSAIKDAKVNGNPKNTVYRPDKDPKLIYSPKVVINTNLIRDYQEKMRLKKAKKFYCRDKTVENYNNSTKTDCEHNIYSHNSYNGITNDHTVIKNHKERENSDHNEIKIEKIIPDNEDDKNTKEVTNDSGLGKELPRWSSVVDYYTDEIEMSLKIIHRTMNSSLAAFREDGAAETFRMRAFEMDYLICAVLGMMRSLLQHSADEDDQPRNAAAVAKYMAQAKSVHGVVNSILSATNYLLPVSS